MIASIEIFEIHKFQSSKNGIELDSAWIFNLSSDNY